MTRTVQRQRRAFLRRVLPAALVIAAGIMGASNAQARPCITIVCTSAATPIIFTSGGIDPPHPVLRVNPDGSQLTTLINAAAMVGGIAGEPTIDQSRTHIAFATGPGEGSQLWVMNADGSGAHTILDASLPPNSLGSIDSPSFSPDGTHIAISTSRDGIDVINVDGTGLHRLSDGDDPAWSPDGRSIAFRRPGAVPGNFDTYVMHADGSNPTKITIGDSFDRPAWSPDSSKIAFASDAFDGNVEIYWTNVTTFFPHRVTNSPGIDREPSWSPDGTRLTYIVERPSGGEIFTIGVDGSNNHHLAWGEQPNWGFPAPAPRPR